MLNRLRPLQHMREGWNAAPMFCKTYLMAILFVGGIVCTGEGLESVLSMVVSGGSGLSDRGEVWVWIAATFIPTALGAYLLTRCFLRPLERVTKAITQLTEGKLHTRVSAVVARRGDELGVLARALNHMAERLEHVFENERNLLAAISHELRSPLTRLSLSVALLRRRGEFTDDDPHIQRLELETERMNDLISQLLHYARREMTAQNRERVDLCDLINDVATDAAFEGMERGITLDISLPESAMLAGNALLLRQAVDNVVRNALRYSPEDSTVHIALHAISGSYSLRVRDHGTGVPDAMLVDIFSPFFRVDADRDRASGGTGMGLSLVEQAVSLHGGQVCAENVADGGLQVVITLPKENTDA